MLSREQILGCSDIPTEIVKVPEWGGEVMVKGLTGSQRDWLEMSIFAEKRETVAMLICGTSERNWQV